MNENLSRRSLLGASAGFLAGHHFNFLRLRGAQLSRSTLVTEPYVVAETTAGKIQGGHSRGALAFKGVPYAGPVSGPNRFKPAPALQPWTGVRDTLALGVPAPQAPNTVYGEREPHPGEDCLVLNVWTPALDGKRRPVLFYNHGGGFMTGSAGSVAQDGGQLAANHDVVVVASNHRLGIFGYLDLEGLGGSSDYAGSGNAGMLDIVDALKWIHHNIANFGGDPHNVTVFGESGGGAKTCALMAMPSAKGLFHKAGIMSGPMLKVGDPNKAKEVTKVVLDQLGISLEGLRDVPMEKLLEIEHEKLPGGFGPVLDERTIVQHPFDPHPAPFVSHIPVLVGNNRDEATFFYWQDPEVFKMDESQMEARLKRQSGDAYAEKALAAFRKDRPNVNPVELFIAISTGGMWGENIEIAEACVKHNRAPVYMYRYDYESNYPIKNTDWTLRAGHATEIQSKFENPDLGGLMGNKPDRFEAAKNFGEVWASFARTGVPHAPGVDRVPAYDLKNRSTLIVDIHSSIIDDPHPAEREAVLNELRKS